ncbi:MAG: PPC domain-containing protein [Phototrophicaceae bacterium]
MRFVWVLLAMVLVACAPQPSEPFILPTLAQLPTAIPSTSPSASSETIITEITAVPSPAELPTITPTSIGSFESFFALQPSLRSTITSVSPVFGAFNAPSERHLYTFQGIAKTFVRVRMWRTSGELDPMLSLYTPQGEAIAVDDDAGGGQSALLNSVELPIDGIYGVLVLSDNKTGTYQITLETAPTPYLQTPRPELENAALALFPTLAPLNATPAPAINGAQLADHVPVQGAIERSGGFLRFPFFASQDTAFSVSVEPSGALRPKLEIFGPNGALVAEATTLNAENRLLLQNVVAPSTGAYIAFITGQDDSVGTFTISYGAGATTQNYELGAIIPDKSYEQTPSRLAVRDVWYLDVHQGDRFSVEIVTMSNFFDPLIELIDPNGVSVAQDDNGLGGVNATLQNMQASQSGRYAVRVRNAQAENVGKYAFVWRYIETAPTPTPIVLSVPVAVIADFVPNNDYRFYPFQGKAGERFLIRLNAQEGGTLDPILSILDPTDQEIASDDDGGGALNSRVLITLPSDGVYQARVGGYSSAGFFELLIDKVD